MTSAGDGPTLTFLGTRAYIDLANRRHRRHSAALLHSGGGAVMLDAGADWRGRLRRVAPDAIVVTHAHPDHAWGLKDGAPCPVYATPAAWADLDDFAIAERRTLELGRPAEICGLRFEAFPVEHSTRCPAVGYRIEAPACPPVFYVPDVAFIPELGSALGGCALYVGDGASLRRSLVRKLDGRLIGHAAVQQQLTWCRRAGVPRALFTHCGRCVVAGDERRLRWELADLAAARGVTARFAYDGLRLDLARLSDTGA